MTDHDTGVSAPAEDRTPSPLSRKLDSSAKWYAEYDESGRRAERFREYAEDARQLEAENARLTAALDAARADTTDAERWRYIRTMLDTGTEPADDSDGSLDYVAVDTIALKDATARLGEYQTVEQLVDAARTQPEGSND